MLVKNIELFFTFKNDVLFKIQRDSFVFRCVYHQSTILSSFSSRALFSTA